MTSADHCNVVVKLGLIRQGEETIFRRVPVELLALTEVSTATGIDIIKKYAVLMFEGTSDITTVNLQNYSIILMYKDLDNDTILMYSDYDMIAALKEYKMTGKLKILAEVKVKDTVSDSVQDSSRATVSTQTFVFKAEPCMESKSQAFVFKAQPFTDSTSQASSQAAPESTTEQSSTSMPTGKTPSPGSVPKVNPPDFSSIASILQFAASAATSAAHSAATSATVTEVLNKAAAAVEEQAKKASATAEANVRSAQAAVNHAAQTASRNTVRAARQADRCARKAARHARRAGTSSDGAINLEGVNNVTSTPRNAEFTPSTSEAVMTSNTTETPAVAAPEPVLAERPFIHGRHTCDGCLTTPIIGKRFHAMNQTDYDLCEKCVLARTGDDSFCFKEMLLERDVPMQGRWHARRSRLLGRRFNENSCSSNVPACASFVVNPTVPPPAPQHPPQNPPNGRSVVNECFGPDLALEEAIRRSLEDQQATIQPVVSDVKSTVTEMELAVEVETVTENETTEDETISTIKDTRSTVSVVAEPLITVEAIVDVDVDVVPEPEIVVEPEVMNTDSVRSAPMATAPVEPNSDDFSEGKTEFYTFMADGEGATANIIGSTLDKMAEAIEGLTWQLDNPVQQDLSNLEQDDLNVDVDSDDDSSYASTDDGKIIEGEVDFDDDDSCGWHVITGDEPLGRAASALGSALFNSEMQRSQETLPVPSQSVPNEAFDGSTVSSIGTSVANLTTTSTVPSTLLERWSTQLNQLHELGFENDHQSVDILESLTAANIGVDNNEEVSVERVINAMMKD